MLKKDKKTVRDELRRSLILYAVTDRQWLKEGETLTDKVREAIEGGATFVQLREKDSSEAVSEAEREAEAIQIKALCGKYQVPFVIDDDVELARKIDCDGVHVGQDDMPADEVRKLLGEDKIVGVSAKTVEQALRAQEMGADYLGVGAVFSTGTKADAKNCPLQTVKAITEAVDIPCIAIGGISTGNVNQLAGLGLDGVAVVSAIFAKNNVRAAAAELREKTEQYLL